MSDPGYVIAGWSLAAIVLGLYSFRLARKIRSAEHARRVERTESDPQSELQPDPPHSESKVESTADGAPESTE